VKDALAYLRALVNPDDEVSWKRIVNTPKRGVGDTSVGRVDTYARSSGLAFREALREGAAAGVTGKALGGIRDLLDVMTQLEGVAAGGVALTMTKMWGGGDDQQVAGVGADVEDAEAHAPNLPGRRAAGPEGRGPGVARPPRLARCPKSTWSFRARSWSSPTRPTRGRCSGAT